MGAARAASARGMELVLGVRGVARCVLVLGFVCAAVMSLAACGAQTPAPPAAPAGGTYSSSTYHFSLRYPEGWSASDVPQSSTANPLTVLVTRANPEHTAGSSLSTLTIVVLDLHDASNAAQAKKLPKDTTKHPITVGGQPAYADTALTQTVPGSQVTSTHIDYYVVRGTTEFVISSDLVATDKAESDVQSMLNSFTFTS